MAAHESRLKDDKDHFPDDRKNCRLITEQISGRLSLLPFFNGDTNLKVTDSITILVSYVKNE
jgi:hypothetical protein